jgi:hypothetical protein
MTFVTTDSVVALPDASTDGITVNDGDASVDWDDVATTDIDNPPHRNAFDTDTFYELEYTVAKPIAQPYKVNDSTLWFKKPERELKRAAWSLDNRPFTLGHPDGNGMVKDVDDIHGFWDQTEYADGGLDSRLYVPVDDSDATEFIEDNPSVSVGFRNKLQAVEDYAHVDSADDTEVVGVQTNMLFDHAAAVKRGRCSLEHGCGWKAASDSSDGGVHGGEVPLHADGENGGRIQPLEVGEDAIDAISDVLNLDEDGVTSVLHRGQTMASDQHMHEGSWYAVPPEDNPDDEWKYVIDNCSDVEDAWKLRNHGDISIEVSTLESRIQNRAEDLGCDVPESETDALEQPCCADCYNGDYRIERDMSCGCDEPDNTMELEIDMDDLSAEVALDKLAAEYEEIEDHIDSLKTRADAADAAAEELDTDVESLADAAGMVAERNDELNERLDSALEPQKRELAEEIAEATDRFGDVEDLVDEDLGTLEDRKELVDDLTDDTSETTANADNGDENEPTVGHDGYVSSPW